MVLEGPVEPFALPSAPSVVAVLWCLSWERGRIVLAVVEGGIRALRRASPTLDLQAIVKVVSFEHNLDTIAPHSTVAKYTPPSSELQGWLGFSLVKVQALNMRLGFLG